MKFKLFKKNISNDQSTRSNILTNILNYIPFVGYSSFQVSDSMKLSTVYRCVNLLSDSVASLPLYPYYFKQNWKYVDEKSTLYNLLNVQPNPFMSSYMFRKQIVQHLLLQGNAYIKITRDSKANIQSLILLNPYSVIIEYNKNNTDIQYVDTITGQSYDRTDVVHIINHTVDGIRGISTISYAANTLGFASNIDMQQSNFFKNGSNLSGLLTPKQGVSISDNTASKIKSKFISSTNISEGSGLVVLDGQFDYTPISISAKDSQLIESKQLTELDIARFFGVPQSLLFSNNSQKFATAEQEQISFLNNSLTALLEKIESEMFRKLYLPSEWNDHELKFDVDNLFRADATTKATYFTQLFNIGALSTNEIREKINAHYPAPGGNQHFIQVNLQPIDNLYVNKGKDVPPPIDNQVKN